MKRLAVFLSALLATSLLVACGSDDDSSPSAPDPPSETTENGTDAVPDESRSGGELEWGFIADLSNGWDPHRAAFNPLQEGIPMHAVYDYLLAVTPEGEIEPRLATGIEPNDDFTEWILTLRSDLVFSDGTDLDAEAVKTNWERIQDPEVGSPGRGDASLMTAIEVLDDLSLQITLETGNSQFPRTLTTYLGSIISPTALAAGADDIATAPVGAGPFLLEEWTQDSRAVLVRNPDYWDAPKPYLDRIIFRPIPDAVQRGDALMSGQVQMASYSSYSPAMDTLEAEGYEPYGGDLYGGLGLAINPNSAPLDDHRVRQALAAALDLDAFAEMASSGAVPPVDTIFLPGTPFYEEDLAQRTNDPELAQQLIDEYMADTGVGEVTIEFALSDSIRTMGEIVQQQVNAIEGFSIEIDVIPATVARQIAQTGDFELTVQSILGEDPEPNMYERLHSESAANFGRYAHPEMDEALERGRASDVLEERQAAYRQAQEIFVEDVPYVLLTRSKWVTYADPQVTGIVVHGSGFIDHAELSLR